MGSLDSKMKSNLDLVNDCDEYVLSIFGNSAADRGVSRLAYTAEATAAFYTLNVEDYDNVIFGHMLKYIVDMFSWPETWKIDHKAQTVTLSGTDLQERNERINSTLLAERDRGTFKLLRKWTGEVLPVYGPGRELVMSIERAACPLFGVVIYGVQLLAYHQVDDKFSIWISKRAMTKSTFPGLLDSTVGGSLPTGETPTACLVREAEEEASFPQSLTKDLARSCGTLNYVNIADERGGGETGLVRPEVQYLYEMRLPEDVTPTPCDNEAEAITLMNVDELKAALAGGKFTPLNGCVELDFFARHGLLTPENEPDYVEVVSRVHRRHVYPTA